MNFRRRCKATTGDLRCDLRRRHSALHFAALPEESWTQPDGTVMSSRGSSMWADSVDQVEETGMFAPWLTDTLRELERERQEGR